MPASPTVERELELLQQHRWIIACDEVGRGALAGPVVVGAALVDADSIAVAMPEGLRDSKLIPEKHRRGLAQAASAWVRESALGWASPQEVDAVGIMRALGLAAMRAIEQIAPGALDPAEGVVILDGNHDYISPAGGWAYSVIPVVKGDRDCASASAASVIAKVARDDWMAQLHEAEPAYEWGRNKGYGSQVHRDAITAHGLSSHHRATWAFQGNTLF